MEKADPTPAETLGFDDLPHKGEGGPVAFPLGKLTSGMKEAPTSPSMGEVVLSAAKNRVRGLVLFNSPHPAFSHPLPCDRGERIENTITLKILVPHWLNSPVEPNLNLS